MSEFDPYLKWLGIREKNLPINHYRLLGLDLFEDDPDVISMAADRQMIHIRTYQSGPKGDISQQILNELARARRCLLMPEKKAEYDVDLRATMSQPVPPSLPASPVEIAPSPVAPTIEASVVDAVTVPIIQPTTVPSSTDSMAPEYASDNSKSSPSIGIRADVNARAKTKKRENKQFLWSILGWISGGLAALGIGAALIGSGIIQIPKGKEVENVDPIVQLNPPDKGSNTTPQNPIDSTNEIVDPKIEELPSDPPKDPNDGPDVSVASNEPSGWFNPDPFEHQFNLANLASYPKAEPSSFGVFGDVKLGLRDKKTVPLEQSSIANGDLIRVTPESGAIVIGLALTTDKDGHVASIRPIFHDGLHAFGGNAIGSAISRSTIETGKEPVVAIAKPGFAVGEIDVSAINPVRCFRIKYMKIARQTLDTSDFYFSKWYGRETGPRRTIRNKNGFPVVGIYASLEKSGSLATLSLVGMDSDGEPENTKLVVSPRIGLPKFFDPKPTEISENGNNPFVVDGSVTDPVVKAPEPSAREQTAARKSIAESIQLMMRTSNDTRSRIRTAKSLIKFADSQDNLLMTYVVLKEAESMGISAGDARTAVDALREIDKLFEIDFWKEVQKTIEKSSRNSSNTTALDFKTTMDELIEEAKDKALFDPARKLLSAAIKLAKRAKDTESTNEYLRLEKELKSIEIMIEASVESLVVLKNKPDDPRANLDQGDFLFVIKDDLDGALEHWLKSGEKKRVELVELLAKNDLLDGPKIVELADAWLALGKSNRTAHDRKSLEQAYDLYRRARFRLTGREQQAVEEKIEKLSKLISD